MGFTYYKYYRSSDLYISISKDDGVNKSFIVIYCDCIIWINYPNKNCASLSDESVAFLRNYLLISSIKINEMKMIWNLLKYYQLLMDSSDEKGDL